MPSSKPDLYVAGSQDYATSPSLIDIILIIDYDDKAYKYNRNKCQIQLVAKGECAVKISIG